MKYCKLTTEDIDVAKALKEFGWPYARIAEYFHCCPATIRKKLHDIGVTNRSIKWFQKDYSSEKSRRKITPERIAALKAEHIAGKSIAELAKRDNYSYTYIWRLINDKPLNVPVRTQKYFNLGKLGQDARKKLSEEDISEMKDLYEKGQTYREIAQKFKCHFTTVMYHLSPVRKKYCHEYAKTWQAINVSPEVQRAQALKTYLKKRAILSAMSVEEQQKILEVRTYDKRTEQQ